MQMAIRFSESKLLFKIILKICHMADTSGTVANNAASRYKFCVVSHYFLYQCGIDRIFFKNGLCFKYIKIENAVIFF